MIIDIVGENLLFPLDFKCTPEINNYPSEGGEGSNFTEGLKVLIVRQYFEKKNPKKPK